MNDITNLPEIALVNFAAVESAERVLSTCRLKNYDGNNSMFGNQALASTSANQAALSVYGALRTSDNAKTIVVINKTYGDLTSTLSLGHVTAAANETAKVFLYSNANLTGIVAQAAAPISPPVASGTTGTIGATFPAQSITLFIVP